jgi:hypothetical protein
MITIQCFGCGEKYNADENHIGWRIRCTRCNRILKIEPTSVGSISPSSGLFTQQMRYEAERPVRSVPRRSRFRKSIWFRVSVGLGALAIPAVFLAAIKFQSNNLPRHEATKEAAPALVMPHSAPPGSVAAQQVETAGPNPADVPLKPRGSDFFADRDVDY